MLKRVSQRLLPRNIPYFLKRHSGAKTIKSFFQERGILNIEPSFSVVVETWVQPFDRLVKMLKSTPGLSHHKKCGIGVVRVHHVSTGVNSQIRRRVEMSIG